MAQSAPKVRSSLAHTINRRAEHSAQRAVSVHLGTVEQITPQFRVELHGRQDVLTESIDLAISQWVRFYHATWGVQLGDNAVLHRISGLFHWVDIVSGTDCSPGAAPVTWG